VKKKQNPLGPRKNGPTKGNPCKKPFEIQQPGIRKERRYRDVLKKEKSYDAQPESPRKTMTKEKNKVKRRPGKKRTENAENEKQKMNSGWGVKKGYSPKKTWWGKRQKKWGKRVVDGGDQRPRFREVPNQAGRNAKDAKNQEGAEQAREGSSTGEMTLKCTPKFWGLAEGVWENEKPKEKKKNTKTQPRTGIISFWGPSGGSTKKVGGE